MRDVQQLGPAERAAFLRWCNFVMARDRAQESNVNQIDGQREQTQNRRKLRTGTENITYMHMPKTLAKSYPEPVAVPTG